MPILEKDIEDPVVKWARKQGVKVRKMNGLGYRSWPDRGFFLPGGKVFFIEFKAPGKQPSKLQEHEIKELKELGYDVEIHDNKENAIAAIYGRLKAGGVDAAPVPKKGHKVSANPRRSRIISRPRIGKDEYNPGGD